MTNPKNCKHMKVKMIPNPCNPFLEDSPPEAYVLGCAICKTPAARFKIGRKGLLPPAKGGVIRNPKPYLVGEEGR